MSLVVGALAAAGAATEASAAITFDGADAVRRFADYVAFLERDPASHLPELATLRQLERSEVEYAVTVGGEFEWNVEGTLTTDGARVLVNIGDAHGHGAFATSANARIAHELEHARQFDDGEIAFEQDPATNRWTAHRASYDLGDEVKAWSAQLRASVGSDLWMRPKGSPVPRPSLLGEFASAETDRQRADVLASRGYAALRRDADYDVAFNRNRGYAARQLLRPDSTRHFFGRVRTVF